MKYILLLCFLMITFGVRAQSFSLRETVAGDATAAIQQAFDRKDVSSVVVGAINTVINGTVKIPVGKTLKIEPGCKISGTGTINGGIIDAGYQQQIFDTTLTVNPQGVNGYFSVKWFGATGRNTDDYNAIQRSINTCIRNNIRTVYLPVGNYKISKPLIIIGTEKDGTRSFCTLELLGESSFWDANMGSQISTTFTNTFAIGIHRGKGCKIRKLKLIGKFVPPFKNDRMKFYNSKFEEFTDGVCRDNRTSPYAAIVIDPFTNSPASKLDTSGYYPGLAAYYGTNASSVQSGSTGTEIEEMSIDGFVVGICSAPNGFTRNAEITLINKIHFNACKLCISGGQDQEKGNTISNIYCWGGTHTIFGTDLYGGKRMAGNWNIDHANIAGGVVRFIYNDQHGYFATNISHIFAESLATWGTINSELACEISDCSINFEYPSNAGVQTLLTSWGENVVYRSCNFRYYGLKDALRFEGNAVFDHCYFSGPLERKTSRNGIFGIGNLRYFKGWPLLGLIALLLSFAGAFFFLKRKGYKVRLRLPMVFNG